MLNHLSISPADADVDLTDALKGGPGEREERMKGSGGEMSDSVLCSRADTFATWHAGKTLSSLLLQFT